MKKILILTIILFTANVSVSANTLNYRIQQNGDTMVIVPYYSTPEFVPTTIPNVESAPAKIPYYSSKKLPKGKNRVRKV